MPYRPKVSVCIASYQGEQFISLQLRSILSQLTADDEVIIVDDHSRDATRSEILALEDSRITLIQNAHNQGVLRTFESALRRATGEIIFLSDQDDLWLPNKVTTVLDAFSNDPALMLVASDALLIDENGDRIGNSYYATRGRFTAGLWRNILTCRFLGCTMTFRYDLLQKALPFPRKKHIHHDIWIGCVNALLKGGTKYIEEPLVAYRRHSSNVTGRIRLSTYKRFQMRWQLIMALLAFNINSYKNK